MDYCYQIQTQLIVVQWLQMWRDVRPIPESCHWETCTIGQMFWPLCFILLFNVCIWSALADEQSPDLIDDGSNNALLWNLQNKTRKFLQSDVIIISYSNLSPMLFLFFIHLSSLSILEIFGCFNLTTDSLKFLGDTCKHLKTLNIGQCYKLTDESIGNLAPHIKGVRHLDLRGCKQVSNKLLW